MRGEWGKARPKPLKPLGVSGGGGVSGAEPRRAEGVPGAVVFKRQEVTAKI